MWQGGILDGGDEGTREDRFRSGRYFWTELGGEEVLLTHGVKSSF